MTRQTRDEWAIALAKVTAQRSTCLRRSVGCVLLNNHGHVIATGYNGVAAGLTHCNESKAESIGSSNLTKTVYPHACPGARSASGTNLDGCQAIHAEQNALLQCKDVHTIHTAYITTSPCVTCCKLLLNTSCSRIIYVEEYPHTTAKDLWESAGRLWSHIEQVR